MLEHFDLILIINLAHREDRWREISAEFEKIGLRIDGQRIRRFDAVRPADPGDFPSIGARGCYMSHLGALKLAQSEGARSLLIIEDDLDFCKDFTQRWTQLSSLLSQHPWQVFYGAGEFKVSDARPMADGLLTMPADKPIATTSFIGLRQAAVQASIPFLEAALLRPAGSPEGGPMHVDGAYCWIRQQNPALTTLVTTPVLGHQRPSRTDIHQLKWFDQMPLVRDIVQRLRQMRHRIHRSSP